MLDSGYILKGVLIDFADILDGYMGGRKRESERCL